MRVFVVGDRLGLPLRETDRAQEFRRHRVDAEGHERHDDPLAAHEGLAQTLRTVAAGPETILRTDADIGFQTIVHRIAHLIAGGEILRYAEDLSRGPIAQHARRILLGESQPPQRTVIDRIGIELEQLRRRLLRSVRRRPAPRRLRFEQQERRHQNKHDGDTAIEHVGAVLLILLLRLADCLGIGDPLSRQILTDFLFS